jgi:aminoglycoside phosphotransferase (APT) family kinase protein
MEMIDFMDQNLKTLTERYGRMRRLTGGFTNAAYLLQDTTPNLVAKVAALSNQDLLNEKNVLGFLGENTFAPQYVDTFSVDSAFILVTTFKEGDNGQGILDTGDMKRATNLFYKMGICLARNIHSMPFEGETASLRMGKPVSTRLDFVPKDLQAQSEAYLKQINWDPSTWVLTHGDYGSHNILFGDNDQFTVIDWEWTEWFHPLVDIAWACWNTKLHYPDIADTLNQTLMNAYQSVTPLDCTDDDIKIYVLYKIWNILNRVQNADKDTQEKWISRLKWTFTTKII